MGLPMGTNAAVTETAFWPGEAACPLARGHFAQWCIGDGTMSVVAWKASAAVGAGVKALKAAADKAAAKIQKAAADKKSGSGKGAEQAAGKGAGSRAQREAKSVKASTPCPFYSRGECKFPGKCGFMCPSNQQHSVSATVSVEQVAAATAAYMETAGKPMLRGVLEEMRKPSTAGPSPLPSTNNYSTSPDPDPPFIAMVYMMITHVVLALMITLVACMIHVYKCLMMCLMLVHI